MCLCGSLRFQSLFQSERQRLTSQGVIVLGPEAISEELTPSRRAALGELHLRRIDLADEIRVVSEGGYIGPATRREIEYAREKRSHQLGRATSTCDVTPGRVPNAVVSDEPCGLTVRPPEGARETRRSARLQLVRSGIRGPIRCARC